VTELRGSVYIKAVSDHKYDGLQLRQLTVSLRVTRRRRPPLDDDSATLDVLRDTALQLPVDYTSCESMGGIPEEIFHISIMEIST